MKIVGIKLTHDASVAYIHNGRLVGITELEKVQNGARYTKMPSLRAMNKVLGDLGTSIEGADSIVLDGWKGGSAASPCGRFSVAPYHEFDCLPEGERPESLLERGEEAGFISGEFSARSYVSYAHVAGHVLGAYVTAPWSAMEEPAAVITWDGGQNPRVHFVDPRRSGKPERCVTFGGALHELYGIIYGIMGYYFGPYANPEVIAAPLATVAQCVGGDALFGGYDTPGKLMSYIALGTPSESLVERISMLYLPMEDELVARPDALAYKQTGIPEHRLCRMIAAARRPEESDADVLASIHLFLERLLVERARQIIPANMNLCFTGGSALNIKWNSALRESGHFAAVWVPPFPNDAGSAFGAAACEMVTQERRWSVDWSAYAGPALDAVPLEAEGWKKYPVSPAELGRMIAEYDEELFVVLYGRAEVGPRALGHRSIFASPRIGPNKERLNAAKKREAFRPVAPICLERFAPGYFKPGAPDPYMLFDHEATPVCADDAPAILHLDNTARLQTMSNAECPVVTAILEAHFAASGIPMLCNTSANFNGKGFFPGAADAMRWGGARFVWAEGWMFEKEVPEVL